MSRLLLLCLLLPWSAWAQTSARVLVIFDTSGSMLWDYEGGTDCYGDGSARYPHRQACRLGSRMFHAKAALSAIVANSPDIEFGLMRYGQLEPADPGFGRLQHDVGAQYRREDGTILASNYDGASNACGPADLLVEPGPMSRARVLRWMDGSESYPNDKELRGNGYTPLTHSMASAREALTRFISADPEADCRPYYVLLLTDGYQQCPGADAEDPVVRARVQAELVQAATTLRNLPVMGARHDVRTFVVGFGPGTAFATELDALARAGGTAVDARGRLDLAGGNAYQANDPQGLVDALQDAIDNAQPRELCDGADNDCDGRVDEGFPNVGRPCSVGVGFCNRDGEIECSADGDGTTCSATPGDPRAEDCNGIDDDCDGQTDEGLLNRCGGCGDVPAEACDGLDNDCDGAVDEGALNRCGGCGDLPDEGCNGRDDDCDGRADEGALNACGACGAVPEEVCDCNDNDCDGNIDEGRECPRCDCEAGPEVCDGLDNDCDNRIDEDVRNRCGACGPLPEEICNGLDEDCDGQIDETFPQRGEPCGIDTGECSRGRLACRGGAQICEGEAGPAQEVCDGLDNDCDGRADEDAYNACGYCGPTRQEICDGIDNDCDGTVDGDGTCPPDRRCVNGECAPPCENGECFDNRICIDGYCLEPCRNIDCPTGLVCRDGQCNDPCPGIECPEGRYCTLGRCVELDCYGGACPDGQLCADGECAPDDCVGAGCGPEQGCTGGDCFDDCSQITCPTGLRCVNGDCVDDACARVTCPFPLVCADGRCGMDPCFGVPCPTGRICEEGRCVDDPCIGVHCPGGAVCHRGRCPGEGRGPGDPGSGSDAGTDGSGASGGDATDGCACDVDGRPGPATWLLVLPLLALRPRRRR
ncbi:MAG: VWA domain-containing protein [bacterium]